MEDEFIQHCRTNNLNGVNYCLSRGVDVNTKESYYQRTGLWYACDRGNSAIVSRLLQVPGLDINYQADGWTAAIWASRKGRTEIVRILAQTGKVDWNKGDKWDQTPLFWALRKFQSDIGIVDIILQQPNIEYNVKDINGDTLAEAAVSGGDVKCVETLAAQETFNCWNVPDRRGDTPIMSALRRERTDIVKVLLTCPRVDLNVVSINRKNIEDIAR